MTTKAEQKTIDNGYKAIGKLIAERIVSRFGKHWRVCFSREIVEALVDAEVLRIVISTVGDETGVREHARGCRLAALKILNLDMESE